MVIFIIIFQCLYFLQTAGLFATSRMVYLIPQTYMPLYFIDTLEMDRVMPFIHNLITSTLYVCTCNLSLNVIFPLQSSIAKGPLILLVTSFITTFAIKWVNKVLGEKVTHCGHFLCIVSVHDIHSYAVMLYSLTKYMVVNEYHPIHR